MSKSRLALALPILLLGENTAAVPALPPIEEALPEIFAARDDAFGPDRNRYAAATGADRHTAARTPAGRAQVAFLAHFPLLLRYAGRYVGPEEAADVTQEAYLRYLERERRGPGLADSHVLPWLLRVTRNLAIDSLRRSTRASAWPEQAESDPRFAAVPADPGAELQQADLRAAMFQLAGSLDDQGKYVRLLEHLLNHDASQANIARELGVSDRTVRRMNDRLARTLRAGLARAGYGKQATLRA